MTGYDVAIVGAGMAGASLAAEVAPHARVLLIEGEAQPGYHATGRSAAFWQESYGGPAVQPLTTASGPALAEGFLTRRGAIHIARAAERPALDVMVAALPAVAFDRLDPAALDARLPGLRRGWDDGLLEAATADIDVAALHINFLARARRAGAVLMCDAPLRAADRRDGRWTLDLGTERVSATLLCDAGGAWADDVARLCGVRPIGIRPYRRTMAQVRLDTALPADLPLVLDAGGGFYVKSLGDGQAWLTPHDEAPCDPCDAAPEEIDVALAIDRLERAFDWRVMRVERRWAGLRSFAPDRAPVYGHAPDMPGFFWCAGQGGFGIQTAPAAARLAAASLLGMAPHPSVSAIDPAAYDPARFG